MLNPKQFLFASSKENSSSKPADSPPVSRENKLQKRRHLEELNKRYQTRVTVARLGQEAMGQKDYVNAIKYYNQYLKIIADIHEVEVYELGPALFGPKEASEKLLISHVFWDMCRICDLSTHLKGELQKNLSMFIVFTTNQPFQALNSEMLRRHFQKGKVKNKEPFEDAFKKIQVSSKKCFVATFALGDQHWVTQDLRSFKNDLLTYQKGSQLVHFYYQISSRAVEFLSKKPFLSFISRSVAIPILYLVVHLYRLAKYRF